MTELFSDLYRYFKGRWHFTRTVSSVGQADGQVEFLATGPSTLRYQESGKLHLIGDQRVLAFSRCFDYLVAGDLVHVRFADGVEAGQAYQSYRHDPVQNRLLPLATHLCKLDRYDACYALLDADHFELQTRITGPHKDHVLQTYFTRVPE